MLTWNEVSWYSLLAGTALKSTAVLGAAWLIATLLRRRSAAARHLVWTAAFASLLALPLLSTALPSLRIPMERVSLPLNLTFRTTASGSAEVPASAAPAPVGMQASAARAAADLNWGQWLLVLWALGAVAAFGQMLFAWAAVRRMRSGARPVADPDVAALKERLAIGHEVRVLETPPGSMPMTFGLRGSTIFLPAEAAEWSAERRRIVLLHELAHVSRGDIAAHLLARAVLNLYWWNPLAWVAWRASIKERELAADDLVLATGARASDYAGHLLEIARSLQSPAGLGAVSVAMARRSQLEGRLVAILDSAVDRQAPGRLSAAAAALLAAALVIPLAGLQAQEAQPSKQAAEELVRFRTIYKDEHPEVQRLKKELAEANSNPTPKTRTEADLQAQLNELLTRYKPSHPEVERVQAELAQLAQRTILAREAAVRADGSPQQRLEYGLALLKSGDLARRNGKLAEAEPLYAKAVSFLGDRPEAIPALEGMGVEALIRKDHETALGYFQRARVIDPTKAGTATMWTAVVRQMQSQPEEAESLFTTALAVQDPNSAASAVTMDLYSMFLRQQNRIDEANAMQERVSALRKALMAKDVPASSGAQVHRIGGEVSAPKLLSKVEPGYSEEARFAKFQGTCVLYAEIGPDGIAHNVRPVRWLGLGLDEKAIEAISQWRFSPGTKDGQPVTVAATIEVNFRLL